MRSALVLVLPLIGCASDPPRRPAAFDPSDPHNVESASAPAPSNESPAPAAEHEHHHAMDGGM